MSDFRWAVLMAVVWLSRFAVVVFLGLVAVGLVRAAS